MIFVYLFSLFKSIFSKTLLYKEITQPNLDIRSIFSSSADCGEGDVVIEGGYEITQPIFADSCISLVYIDRPDSIDNKSYLVFMAGGHIIFIPFAWCQITQNH
jgi:hypothetical protein